MNYGIFNLCLYTQIYCFLENYEGYDHINETNKFINNYHNKNPLVYQTRLFKREFVQKHLPLGLNISSKKLTSLFLWCIDMITEEDLLSINNIFEPESNSIIKINDEITTFFNTAKCCENSQRNFDQKNDKKKKIYFSKIDILKKLELIHFYVFNVDFIKDYNVVDIQEFVKFANKLVYLKDYKTRCVYDTCQNRYIVLTLPEYYILGVWSYFKSVSDGDLIGGNVCRKIWKFIN